MKTEEVVETKCCDCEECSPYSKKYECELCEDTGRVAIESRVYSGEGHYANLGKTSKCPRCYEKDYEPYE